MMMSLFKMDIISEKNAVPINVIVNIAKINLNFIKDDCFKDRIFLKCCLLLKSIYCQLQKES